MLNSARLFLKFIIGSTSLFTCHGQCYFLFIYLLPEAADIWHSMLLSWLQWSEHQNDQLQQIAGPGH